MVFTIASCLCPLSRVAQMGLLAMGPEELAVSGSLVMLSDERGFSKIQSGGVYRWEMTATLAAKPGKSVEHSRRFLAPQSGDCRSRGRRLKAAAGRACYQTNGAFLRFKAAACN